MKQSRKRISKVKRISRKQDAGKLAPISSVTVKSCNNFTAEIQCKKNGCKWKSVIRKGRYLPGICTDK